MFQAGRLYWAECFGPQKIVFQVRFGSPVLGLVRLNQTSPERRVFLVGNIRSDTKTAQPKIGVRLRRTDKNFGAVSTFPRL
jgi:hypothetical protein